MPSFLREEENKMFLNNVIQFSIVCQLEARGSKKTEGRILFVCVGRVGRSRSAEC